MHSPAELAELMARPEIAAGVSDALRLRTPARAVAARAADLLALLDHEHSRDGLALFVVCLFESIASSVPSRQPQSCGYAWRSDQGIEERRAAAVALAEKLRTRRAARHRQGARWRAKHRPGKASPPLPAADQS